MYCQKCRTPLKVDGSLEGLNVAAYDVLVGSTTPVPKKDDDDKLLPPRPPHEEQRQALYDEVAQQVAAATTTTLVPTFKRHGSAGRDASMSFIYLTESQVVQPSTILPGPEAQQQPKARRLSFGRGRPAGGSPTPSKEAEAKKQSSSSTLDETGERARLNRLFEILSARSDIDHPVCVECSDALMAGLQRRLEDAAAERDAYAQFLKEHRAQGGGDNDQELDNALRRQEESLRRARADEEDARAELKRLEREKAAVDAELLALEAESRALDNEEEQFWRSRNAFAARLQDFHSERDSVMTRYEHDRRLYERLTRTNVHNDTFSISHDGTYGTINGLRLGLLSSAPVEWSEINAAWGHALLLLVTVADKLGYRFVGFEPKPMGSTSRIVRYDLPPPSSTSQSAPPKKTVLELFHPSDIINLLLNRSFNAAMVAFLELVRQLGEFVRRQMAAQGKNLGLPYRIEADRIHDHSIKLGMKNEDSWTKACKLTLTCCKFLLAHASNVGSADG